MRKNPSWIIVSQKAAADISFQALIPAVVLTALAFLTVGLRWWSRVRFSGGWGVEDVLVTFALVFSIAFTGIVGGELQIDVDSADDVNRVDLLAQIMKLMFAGSICYHISVNLVRFSVLFQYHKIFQHLFLFRICIYIVSTVTLAAITWGVFGVVFLCEPIQKYWYGSIEGHCMDAEDHFWSSSLIGIVLDFVLWFMPIPVLGRLKLAPRAKVGLLVPFGMGLFVCIVAVLRLVQVHRAAEMGDVGKSGAYAAIWSTAEINVAIICSSLLVMKPMLTRIMPSLGMVKPPTAREEDSGIRRMLSIVTLQEELAGIEANAGYEARIWTTNSSAAGASEREKKENV